MDSKTYIPEGLIKQGWLSLWKDMIKELISSRELIIRLFIRDFLAKYKQAALGVTWIIIMPVVVIGSFIFMNKSGILNIGETPIPYPAFAILGLTIWQLFATGLTATTNSVVKTGKMIVKINFPKEVLIISSLAQSVFDFLIRIVIVAIVFAFYRIVPSWKIIFFPISLIPLLLFALGLGFMFSLLNCVLRDTTNMVSLGTTFLLFLTPVLYPEPKKGIFVTLSKYNILLPLVTTPRELIVTGTISQPTQYLIATIISVLIFLFSWRIFHLVEPKLAERI